MSPKSHPQVVSLSKLTKFRLFLLYSFPVVLFCSYFPIIPIVSTTSTNYELSLPLIWLLLFSVISLKDFALYIYNIYNKKPLRLTLLLFPIYLSLTSLWSVNPLRAIMTAGIVWCLIITGVVIFTTFYRQKLLNSRKFLRIFFYASTAFCALCWLQSILDVANVGRETTLLCLGCTSYSFGFPHPSGLAIEPQFMGNLLLAPALTALFLWTKPKSSQPSLFGRKALLLFSLLFSSTLFLTFSRGAVYSFILGLTVLIILNLTKLKNHRILKALPLLVVSAAFILLIQGLFSALSPTNSTFLNGIEKSISQMTLGKVNLHLETEEYHAGNDIVDPEFPKPPSSTTTQESSAPVFDGYVEESTNARMNFNRIALELAPKSPATLLFGYGLGSAGETMYKEGKTTTPFEIVQNEYLSLLLETGLVGLLLAALSIAIILSLLKKLHRPERFLLEAAITSFLFSLLFFSGLPNALHIYLFPLFLVVTLPSLSRKQPSLSRA